MLADRGLFRLPNATGEDRASALAGYAFATAWSVTGKEGLTAGAKAIELSPRKLF